MNARSAIGAGGADAVFVTTVGFLGPSRSQSRGHGQRPTALDGRSSALRRSLTLVASLLASTAFAGVARYDVSASALVTTRAPLPGDVAVGATTDLQLDPALSGSLAWSSSLLTLRYAPQLIIREPQLAPRLLPLHHAILTFTRRFERASLMLSEDASYGVADVGSLRLPDGSRPGGVFEVQTLGSTPYVRSASFFALDGQPGARVRLALSGGYLLSGDPTGGARLPLQQGPTGTGSMRFVLDRRLGLSTTAQATHAWFNTGAEQSIVLVTESLDWRASRSMTVTVGAGAAWTRERIVEVVGGPPPGLFTEVLPVALASLSSPIDVLGLPVQLDLGVRMAPFADRFTGLVYERVEARGSVSSRLTRTLTLTSAIGSGYAIALGRAQQAGDSATFGEAALSWNTTRWLSLVGTGRAVYTEQPRFMMPGQLLWSLSIAAVVRDTDSTTF
ncbi:MAG: hypothetical protein GQE15_24565 [Archangiaceae bacterium]|nr:hypothetical protein [Archangiaceae bacterium]